jgi:hypothetical protein
VITVDPLTKTYGTFTAVDDVSFTARPGRVTLLQGRADDGATVLLSSHLLHEIEVVAQGTKADLLASAGTLVRTRDVTAMSAALTASGVRHTASSAIGGEEVLRVETDTEMVGRIALDARVALTELRAATGPVWKRCSSSSPPTSSARPPPKEKQHDQSPSSW